MIWYAVRPGGVDGNSGRGISLGEVLSMTIPQLVFICHERKAKDGEELVGEIKQKAAEDRDFKQEYEQARRDAIRKAKERLNVTD